MLMGIREPVGGTYKQYLGSTNPELIDLDISYEHGSIYESQGMLDKAAEIYQNFRSQYPNNIYAYYLLASISDKQGNYAEAINFYNQALKLKSNSKISHLKLSNKELEQKIQEVEKLFREKLTNAI